ncbi:MAG: pilus assembly protein [Rhodospirillales bacterium]|nr:pilus assembly protein [Rhodospirillales bacterium]
MTAHPPQPGMRPGLRRDRRGAVAVEAAIVLALVLVPVAFGLLDLGEVLTARLRVDRALQAGLFAAWAISGPSAAQITQAATAGAGGGAHPVAASASFACYCLAPTATLATASAAVCSGSCGSGQVLGEWVSLTASASVSLPFPLPGVPGSLTLTASGSSRIQ